MRPAKVVGKIRDGKLVREDDEATQSHFKIPGAMINWELLAKQKAALVNLISNRDDHILQGLIGLIDEIQDRASEAGHPVVWVRTDE